jgi:hypothetical protein
VRGWDGDEVLIWVEANTTNRGQPTAAAYRPASDRWRTLRSSAPGFVAQPVDATGPEDLVAWVSESSLPGTDFGDLIIASYSKRDDTWRSVTKAPRAPMRYLQGAAFGRLVVAVSSVPDKGSLEWTRKSGWKAIDLPSARGASALCLNVFATLDGLPTVIQCDRVSRRTSHGWRSLPNAPRGGIYPLQTGGFVVVGNTKRIWWYH